MFLTSKKKHSETKIDSSESTRMMEKRVKEKKEETKRDIELEKSAESVSFCVINTSAE